MSIELCGTSNWCKGHGLYSIRRVRLTEDMVIRTQRGTIHSEPTRRVQSLDSCACGARVVRPWRRSTVSSLQVSNVSAETCHRTEVLKRHVIDFSRINFVGTESWMSRDRSVFYECQRSPFQRFCDSEDRGGKGRPRQPRPTASSEVGNVSTVGGLKLSFFASEPSETHTCHHYGHSGDADSLTRRDNSNCEGRGVRGEEETLTN